VINPGVADQKPTPNAGFLPTDLYKNIQSLFNNAENNFNNSIYLIMLGFLIGILHSLSPGHGKTIMGTYIAVTNSGIFNIMLLAVSITLSHILVVGLIAILFLWLRSGVSLDFLGLSINLNFDIKSILPYLSTISGLIVFTLGLVLIWRRLRPSVKSWKLKKQSTNSFFNLNANYAVLDDGDHSHKIPRFKMDVKQSLMLGISTGLVPCVEVISLLILAINLEKIWSGIAVLVSFSLGMGFTLTFLGWLMKTGLDRSQNIKFMEKFYKNIPLISAILIMISGIFTIFWGLNI
jgi:ABC-type nickel/cobalt efflux system permease component RcnA